MSRLFGIGMLATSSVIGPWVATPSAGAQACPDVEVVFARGTFEPPGVGVTGQAFVDALRADAKGKSVDVYAVNYPASLDFATAADGVIDASNKVQSVAAQCPNTKIVLGGYSQGAAVAGYITADAVPPGFTLPPGISGPLPKDVSDHVAAVALFGKPSNGFLQAINVTAPPIVVGSQYAQKTTELCIPDDPICAPGGNDNAAHGLYVDNGLTSQAAGFAARRIESSGRA